MTIEQVLNSIGKPVWIVLMVTGFIWFWPVGLAILCYLLWSGRIVLFGSYGFSKSVFGSGNNAFDEHRQEVLRGLAKERDDFDTFVANLAKAKDKAEFDQFMASRK